MFLRAMAKLKGIVVVKWLIVTILSGDSTNCLGVWFVKKNMGGHAVLKHYI